MDAWLAMDYEQQGNFYQAVKYCIAAVNKKNKIAIKNLPRVRILAEKNLINSRNNDFPTLSYEAQRKAIENQQKKLDQLSHNIAKFDSQVRSPNLAQKAIVVLKLLHGKNRAERNH